MDNPIWLVVIASLIAVVPILVGVLTAYVKISIVLGFLRSGLGAQQVPGNLAVMALSLALTAYVMSPVVSETLNIGRGIDTHIFQKTPTVSDMEIILPLFQPWQKFMLQHSGTQELLVLNELAQSAAQNDATLPNEDPSAPKAYSLRVIMPAFALTEIKQGFAMGFVLLLPFLIVDLVVANVLAGLGMYMLSPVIISLPLKLILFVMADGWLLLTKGLIQSYGGP